MSVGLIMNSLNVGSSHRVLFAFVQNEVCIPVLHNSNFSTVPLTALLLSYMTLSKAYPTGIDQLLHNLSSFSGHNLPTSS